jgi:hypothetical protein
MMITYCIVNKAIGIACCIGSPFCWDYSFSFAVVSGQVNPNMPRTFGDGVIHMSHLDAMVQVDHPLPEIHKIAPSLAESKIGQFIADNLVQDGATLQMGKCFSFQMQAI